MTRSAEAAEMWRQQTKVRRYALEPLKTALAREGRTQTWLARQLGERIGIQVAISTLNNYVMGHARIPRNVLSAACWIAGARENDVLGRVADEALLIQQPRTRKQQPAQRRKTASV